MAFSSMIITQYPVITCFRIICGGPHLQDYNKRKEEHLFVESFVSHLLCMHVCMFVCVCFFIFSFFKVCVYTCLHLVCICTMCRSSQRPEQGNRAPGPGVRGGCEPPRKCWEPNPSPLLEQVLLNTELSKPPLHTTQCVCLFLLLIISSVYGDLQIWHAYTLRWSARRVIGRFVLITRLVD